MSQQRQKTKEIKCSRIDKKLKGLDVLPDKKLKGLHVPPDKKLQRLHVPPKIKGDYMFPHRQKFSAVSKIP